MGKIEILFNTISYFNLLYSIIIIIILSIESVSDLCGNILPIIIISLLLSLFGFIIFCKYYIQRIGTEQLYIIWSIGKLFLCGMSISSYINLEKECEVHMKQSHNSILVLYEASVYIIIVEFAIFLLTIMGIGFVHAYYNIVESCRNNNYRQLQEIEPLNP